MSVGVVEGSAPAVAAALPTETASMPKIEGGGLGNELAVKLPEVALADSLATTLSSSEGPHGVINQAQNLADSSQHQDDPNIIDMELKDGKYQVAGKEPEITVISQPGQRLDGMDSAVEPSTGQINPVDKQTPEPINGTTPFPPVEGAAVTTPASGSPEASGTSASGTTPFPTEAVVTPVGTPEPTSATVGTEAPADGTTPFPATTEAATTVSPTDGTTPAASAEGSSATSPGTTSGEAQPGTGPQSFDQAKIAGVSDQDIQEARNMRAADPQLSEADALKAVQDRRGTTTAQPKDIQPGSPEERHALGIEDTPKQQENTTFAPDSEGKRAQDRLNKLTNMSMDEVIQQKTVDPETNQVITTREQAAAYIAREKAKEQGIIDYEKATPEKRLEMDNKAIEDAYVKATELLETPGKEAEALQALMQFNEKWYKADGLKQSLDGQNAAREFIKGILNPGKKNQRELPAQRNVREKLQQLAQLEMQLRQRAETLKRLKQDKNKLKGEVSKARDEYLNQSNPTEKQKKFTIFSAKAMQLAQVRANITITKALGREVRAKTLDTVNYINRKLRVRRNPLRNLLDSAWANAYGMYAGARLDFESNMED